MEVKTITVNKTQDRPDGIKIDVVLPQSPLETDLLCYLLAGYLRDAQKVGRLKMELPDVFQIRYQAEGSFLVSTAPGANPGSPYYTPPKPLAVVAVQRFGRRFDIAYASLQQSAFKAQKGAAASDAGEMASAGTRDEPAPDAGEGAQTSTPAGEGGN